MRNGWYSPSGAFRRVTRNAMNRAFIKGGITPIYTPAPAPTAPVFIGPPIPQQDCTVGVPYSYDAGAHFAGDGFYSLRGDVVPWLSIDPVTGVMSGTPDAGGAYLCLVRKELDGLAAQSNQFFVGVLL